MHESINQHLLPMQGAVETETRRASNKAERVRAVLSGLPGLRDVAPEPEMRKPIRFTQPAEGVGYTDRPDAS